MEQYIEFLSNHWELSTAWAVVAVLLIIAQLTAMKNGVKGVTTQQLTRMINKEDALVIDIRPIADFNKGHISGSRNIPSSKLVDSHKELEKFKTKPIILVCANGIQVGAAGLNLKKSGFEMVYKLSGGFSSWKGDNLPVVTK